MTDAGICWLILAVGLSVAAFMLYAMLCVAANGDDRAGDR